MKSVIYGVTDKITFHDYFKAKERCEDLGERIQYIIDNKIRLYTDKVSFIVKEIYVAEMMWDRSFAVTVIIDAEPLEGYDFSADYKYKYNGITLENMTLEELLPTKSGEKCAEEEIYTLK